MKHSYINILYCLFTTTLANGVNKGNRFVQNHCPPIDHNIFQHQYTYLKLDKRQRRR